VRSLAAALALQTTIASSPDHPSASSTFASIGENELCAQASPCLNRLPALDVDPDNVGQKPADRPRDDFRNWLQLGL
jgi:hypothetical protein